MVEDIDIEFLYFKIQKRRNEQIVFLFSKMNLPDELIFLIFDYIPYEELPPFQILFPDYYQYRGENYKIIKSGDDELICDLENIALIERGIFYSLDTKIKEIYNNEIVLTTTFDVYLNNGIYIVQMSLLSICPECIEYEILDIDYVKDKIFILLDKKIENLIIIDDYLMAMTDVKIISDNYVLYYNHVSANIFINNTINIISYPTLFLEMNNIISMKVILPRARDEVLRISIKTNTKTWTIAGQYTKKINIERITLNDAIKIDKVENKYISYLDKHNRLLEYYF